MNKILLYENDSAKLEHDDADSANEILKQDSTLPFTIEDSVIKFKPYTIGQLQLKHSLIEILPRNPAFTLKTYFEMILFTDFEKFEPKLLASTYEQTQGFGISSVASQFCRICTELLKFGLTGNILYVPTYSKTVNGRILFEEFHKSQIPIRGVKTEKKRLSINIIPNQIIKSALVRLLLIGTGTENSLSIKSILNGFDYVDDFSDSYILAETSSQNFFSSNIYYPIALEYALRILKDLKISYNEGIIDGFAFLQNSNTVFEAYVRKVLKVNLKEQVEKLDEGKNYANISFQGTKLVKSIHPDIVIGYNREDQSCIAILDAKNKPFSSGKILSGDVPSSDDVYQLAFYCRRMNAPMGALIYPSSEEREPIEVNITDENNSMFLLFSVNMHDDINSRHLKLVDQVKEFVLERT